MTKKIITLLLAATMIFTLAACSGKKPPSKANYEGSLEDLMTAIYEKKPVEIALTPPTAVDLTNADNVKYFLGLSDAANIKEAIFSEPMMSAQAYSLCLVRAKDDADIEALKQSIIDGVNPRKWICVGTDKVIVTSYGDVIALIMTADAMSETLSGELYDAFGAVVGGELGKKLERTAE